MLYKNADSWLKVHGVHQGHASIGEYPLYFLSGGAGGAIRAAEATNGFFQIGYGVRQGLEGDSWNAAGNIVAGALGVASLGIPRLRLPADEAIAPPRYGLYDVPVSAPGLMGSAGIDPRYLYVPSGPKESASSASSVQQISGGNIRHINGALGEAHGWKNALDSGHVPVKAPGNVTAPGVDFVTYDPKSGRVVLWDSKYRGPGGSYPSSIPESKLNSWTAEARAAVVQMPEGAMKSRILDSLDKGKVDAKVFRWPQ